MFIVSQIVSEPIADNWMSCYVNVRSKVKRRSAENLKALYPTSRFLESGSMDQRSSTDFKEQQKGNFILIKDVEDIKLGKFDKRLPYCGCGMGWFCLLLGFMFPLMWYYATVLYFWSYYDKDPRERAGLAANAIAASIFTIGVLIIIAIFLLL